MTTQALPLPLSEGRKGTLRGLIWSGIGTAAVGALATFSGDEPFSLMAYGFVMTLIIIGAGCAIWASAKLHDGFE